MDTRTPLLRLIQLLLLNSMAGSATPATIFHDGFEAGSISPAWEISTTGDGRVRASSDHGPAAGQWQMVMDDSVSDALYSSASATIRLNLSNKRNVVLSFKAKSLGNEPDYLSLSSMGGNPENFDGVSLSNDGGVTWRLIEWLGEVATDWETFSIRLDDYFSENWRFGPDVLIRFSEFDNAPAPLDGIAIDDVLITADLDQRAVLELPPSVMEGTGPHTGFVMLTFASTNDVTLNLVVSPADQLALPATVEIPAGKTYASFSFSVLNDDVITLSRTTYARAEAPGFRSIQSAVTILDDEVPVATLVIPSQLTEGDNPWNNASVSLDRPADVPISMEFSMDPWGEIELWSGVTIPAGETSMAFTIRAANDDRIDGTVPVAVTVKGPGMAPVTAHTSTLDNDTRTLSLTFPPTMLEGRTGDAALQLSGSLSTDSQVQLTSANPAALSVPAYVTVPAGQRQVEFKIKAVDNLIHDGSRNVTISASAATFTNATGTITVRDNDVASYLFGGLTDIVDLGQPLALMIHAADKDGNIINEFVGNVSLTLILNDGTIKTVTPSTIHLTGPDGWAGDITLPPVSSSPLRLRATDTNGIVSDSIAFDTMRVLDLAAADLVWDAMRGRVYASVPAENGGTNANRVVAIDPLTAQVTGGVGAGQNPSKLVLTGESEFLYVALDGNGTIARINPETMTTNLTFAVGTSPTYGTLYAADMCAVAGQPKLVVISQKRKVTSPEHNGVAVYDNGVVRLNKTQEHTGSNVIEPSADPGIFFGLSTEGDNGFRRLRLDASGMTEIENNQNLFQGYGNDIRSAGNKVFSTGGVELDGAQMRRVGTFPVKGLVCPELAASRVFFLESMSPDSYWYPYDRIGVYDSVTFSNMRRLKLPAQVTSARSFIRWGTNGLAFITGTNVVLINSSRLVLNDPPANLAVTVNAAPSLAAVSTPLFYTVTVSNQGPNVAKNTFLMVNLSDGQAFQSALASIEAPVVFGNNLTLDVGELAAGASVTLTTTTLPDSAGTLTCKAIVASRAPDPDFSDNSATNIVGVGFHLALNAVSRLRLAANNLIYDATRNLFWASLPATVDAPFGKTVVSIDPNTGLISAPIPINGNPVTQCMAISKNGRYLYVGLNDTNQVHRIDLNTPSISLRVPLGLNTWGSPNYALDLDPLDGAGTSFLMTGSDQSAAVYDGAVRRGLRTENNSVSYIERTGTPGVFVGFISGYQINTLIVTAAGVTNVRQAANIISGYNTEIRGAGNLVLSSSGLLVDSTNLTLVATLGANLNGRPCLDLANHRAYLVQGSILRSFDTTTFLPAGGFELPFYPDYYWYPDRPELCIRWGLDGFAYLSSSGNIHIWRWSETIPASVDANGDGMSDAWEATYFSSLNVDPAGDDDRDGIPNFLEYLYASSPVEASANPVQASVTNVAHQTFIRLIFPCRAGLSPRPYEYLLSSDLAQWAPALDVSETILSTQTVGGVQVETVEALIPPPNPVSGFVRFKWSPH